MGQIVYGSGVRTIPVDDVTLAYVKTIAVMKLRRNEAFTITLQTSASAGPLSVWVHPSIGLQFLFDEDARVELDRTRLEALMQAANRTGDLRADPIEETQRIAETRTTRAPAKRTLTGASRTRAVAAA